MTTKFLYNVAIIHFIFLFQFFNTCGYSQTALKGKILTNNNIPVIDASVVIMLTVDSTIVAYNFSNTNGDYEIYYSGSEDSLLFAVQGFNIKRQIQKIANQSQTINLVVSEELILLEEFTIKSEKIWGTRDTINYIVDAFRNSTDIVIGDVLKKIPGIAVNEIGQIMYRGKPINKFYIENMDMLQGRYGIATNNITASNIATVQVFENHQPIRALKDVTFSDEAAINLKLKQGAKGIYSIMANLGIGTDKHLLWNGEVTGLYFGKTRQHLASYLTNNTGNDLETEFQSFYNENMELDGAITSMVMPSPPKINKKRFYFNNAHGITINSLFKQKDNSELTFNLIGLSDNDDRKSYAQTKYIIPGSDTITVNEQMNSFTKNNKLEGDISYNRNNDLNYLKARLLFTGIFNESTGSIDNNNDIVDQIYDNNSLRVVNSIHWIKRGNNNKQSGIELGSRSLFESQPYRLEVKSGINNVFNDGLPYDTLEQNVSVGSFQTDNSLRLLTPMVWKSIRIQPILLFSMEHQSLNSHLAKLQNGNSFNLLTNDSLNNNLEWMQSKTGVSLKLTYRKKNFNFEFSTPLQYHFVLLTDKNQFQKSQQNRFLFQPQFSLLYNINMRWEISGSYYLYSHTPDLRTLYSGYILQNYRTLTRYQNKLSDSFGQLGKLKLSYKNIMKFLFTSIEFSYNQYRNDVMYAQLFEGSVLNITLIELKNTGNYISVTGNVGKSYDWKKISFNAEASWSNGITPLFRQDSLLKYKSQGINANITLSMEFSNNFFFNYECNWSQIIGSTGSDNNQEPIINFNDVVSFDITLAKNFILNMGINYYKSLYGSRKQSFYLLDAGFAYTWKKVRFSLDCSNILNTKNYVHSFYDNLNSYYSKYLIRPSSVMLNVRLKLY